jgi:hypothetical protein
MIMRLVELKAVGKNKFDLVFHSKIKCKSYISYLVYSTEIKHDIRQELTFTELYNLYE